MKKIWLALGGWAARWYAHIGVIQYLEENHYEIAEIAGTSMGALVGAIYASGKTVDEMRQIAREVDYKKMIDYDRNHGWLRGKKSIDTIRRYIGNKKFSELSIPLSVAVHNITTGKLEIFNQESDLEVALAVRASTSLPSIFAPCEINGNLYVDGGSKCNLPVNFLHTENKIAVSTLSHTPFIVEKNQRKRIWKIPLPKIFGGTNFRLMWAVLRDMLLDNEELAISQAKNVIIIRPEYGDLHAGSYKRADELVKLWYQAAHRILNEKNF